MDRLPAMYLVGGPVRDALLGTPVKDLDFVLEGEAAEVARRLAAELGGRVVSHARFGTASLLCGDVRVDLVTARKETYPHPGALPQVSAGTISDDLARRDFSVNALAIPLAVNDPQVMDAHGGIADLRLGLIRTLHSESFVDDPTRVLRAVRYEQRLGFRIEENHSDPASGRGRRRVGGGPHRRPASARTGANLPRRSAGVGISPRPGFGDFWLL